MYTLLQQPSNVYLVSEVSILTNLYYIVVNGRIVTNWFYNRKTIFTKNGMLTSSKF